MVKEQCVINIFPNVLDITLDGTLFSFLAGGVLCCPSGLSCFAFFNVCSKIKPFQVTGHFDISTMNTTRSKIPLICPTCVENHKFQCTSFYGQIFLVTCRSKTSVTDSHKMTLKTTRSKVPMHMVLKVPIALSLTLIRSASAVFTLHSIRQVNRMTPK